MAVQPATGRVFAPAEYLDDHPHVAVISPLAKDFHRRRAARWPPVQLRRRVHHDRRRDANGFDYPAGTDVAAARWASAIKRSPPPIFGGGAARRRRRAPRNRNRALARVRRVWRRHLDVRRGRRADPRRHDRQLKDKPDVAGGFIAARRGDDERLNMLVARVASERVCRAARIGKPWAHRRQLLAEFRAAFVERVWVAIAAAAVRLFVAIARRRSRLDAIARLDVGLAAVAIVVSAVLATITHSARDRQGSPAPSRKRAEAAPPAVSRCGSAKR